ncbi:hypothetical protein GCM10011348_23490 [Marinobacterium nitratireducens]|uniref:Tetratricopeptide repeat protein n=1 Tax=Marinobacterium nitratireducens TaxID=518897 RepID=A0A918DU27_9GAMM|nr:tetratricopeptide repeat protein [Marinobacterium nitratireducens]GGO82335.1 hypothetical protein GCM10011348_23490 [Marinobacterium nitratireducens]
MLTAVRSSLSILLALTLAACSSDARRDEVPAPQSPYCLRGGSDDVYSCDEASREPLDSTGQQPDYARADLDARLAEIKSWLRSEKAALQSQPGNGDESDVRLPPPTPEPAPATEKVAPPLPSLLPDTPYREALAKAAELERRGYPEHARQLLRQLSQQYPRRPEAYNNLGVMLAANGQYSEAIEQLQLALATHPHYARIHENLRDLYGAIADSTYTDAMGMRRRRAPPQLQTLDAAQDAGDDDSIAARVGAQIELWAEAPGYTPEQQASLYLPGYRPDDETSHRLWLESLAQDDRTFRLQEYELAIMSPDWIEVRVSATRPGSDKPEQHVLTLVRNGSRWLISSER